MNKVFLIIVFNITSVLTANSNELISQGSVKLTLNDFDGFAWTLPKDKRRGFFDSPVRIDNALNSLINMKHLVKYGKSNGIINEKTIDKLLTEYLFQNNENIEKLNLSDYKFLEMKKYLKLKYSYEYIKDQLSKLITEDDVINLAKEQYILTQENYFHEDKVDVQYISVGYNTENKQKQFSQIKILLQEVKEQKTFDDLEFKYKDIENIRFIKGIKDYTYDEKYKLFSEFIFNSQKQGFIYEVLDTKSTFIIVEVLKFTNSGYKDFHEVKDIIVQNLLKEKIQRDFKVLMNSLKSDPLIINENHIISIRDRYVKST